jgi:hypothetical protein
MTVSELLPELESEFEQEMGEAEGFLPSISEVQTIASFSAVGFETTPKFRQNFIAINHVFLQKGKFWGAQIFRNDFCTAKHYLLNIPGAGVRRFAVLRGFPIEYRKQQGKKPLLIDIGRPGGTFVAALETRGHVVKIPYRPCQLPRHSVAKGLEIWARSKLLPH